jgi:hypothetical protein
MKASDAMRALTADAGTVTDEAGSVFRVWSLAPVQNYWITGIRRDTSRTDFAWVVETDGGSSLSLVLIDVPTRRILWTGQQWATPGRMAA